MAPTGSAELLTTWETGLAQQPPARAGVLHRTARPDAADEQLLSLPLGERAADLFDLRRALFGDRMQVVVECGECGEVVEFDLDARELARRPEPPDGGLRVAEDGFVVEFRLPTAADVEHAAAGNTTAERRLRLLSQCTLSAARDGEPIACEALPQRIQRRIADAAEHADPAAVLMINVVCPHCDGTTPAELDIAVYLWAELDSWARDVLLDVHLLASAYGWSEPQILALSPLRRRYYLELCADG